MDLKSLKGTNYYVMIGEGKESNLIHIGKASYGYRFLLRWNPELYADYTGFLNTIRNNKIYNHFGRKVSPDFLINFINDKVALKPVKPYFDKMDKSHLIHLLQETKDDKPVAGHPFIDEDFGILTSEIKLKD